MWSTYFTSLYLQRQMMKIIHQDAAPAAVTAAPDMVAINAALCRVYAQFFHSEGPQFPVR